MALFFNVAYKQKDHKLKVQEKQLKVRPG